jgi:hypothetical protein
MPYIHRDKDGKIITISKWPNGSKEKLKSDNPEVVAFTEGNTPKSRVIDGERLSQETFDELNACTTISGIKNVLIKILKGS